MMPVALTIAGNDPSGGAGMLADVKTFAAFGVYGMAVLTVATDCNTEGVTQMQALPEAFVQRQIEQVCGDIRPDAIKTGMLHSEAVIRTVIDAVQRHALSPLVVDPVMTTRRGERLLSDGAEDALAALLPLAAVITPSLPEAERLTGYGIVSRRDMEHAAETIFKLGPGAVIIKGGHREDDPQSDDFFFDGEQVCWLEAERVPRRMHGAGDTFSAALAAGLAQGLGMFPAARQAKAYVTGAIRHAPDFGQGNGPPGHAWFGCLPFKADD